MPALLCCFPLGIVALWLRPGTTTRMKSIITAAAAVLVMIALLMSGNSADPGADPGAGPPSTARSTPSPADSESPDPVEVSVPQLEGRSLKSAKAKLVRLGLSARVSERRPSAQPKGTVLSQRLEPGSLVEEGTSVELVVASPLPRVPSLVGRDARAAAGKLRRAGFRVERLYRTVISGQAGAVIEQIPAPGRAVRPGGTVTLVIARLAPTLSGGGGGGCTPGYSPCLPPASDYDCAGGSGNGPKYASGVYRITGPDIYDLDYDNDGFGCED